MISINSRKIINISASSKLSSVEQVLDIYARVIIAVMSVPSPLLLFLVGKINPTFLHFEEKSKTRTKVAQIEFAEEYASKKLDKALLRRTLDKFEKIEEDIKKIVNLLNPKIQLFRIYVPLSSSLAFLMAHILVRSNYYGSYDHVLSLGLIVSSVLLFIFTIYALITVALALIKFERNVNTDDEEITPES